jgi:hypothetical protein
MPVPAGSSWYTVHEEASAAGDGRVAAEAGPAPRLTIPHRTEAEANSELVLGSGEGLATEEERRRRTPMKIVADSERWLQ